MAADLLVRPATPDDAPALAALRWLWAVPDRTPSDDEALEFAGALRRWMDGLMQR